MNKNYTLKELADIGARAANSKLPTAKYQMTVGLISTYPEHANAREAFTKAILDAIGYEFPKDEEREAFERWHSGRPNPEPFDAWKAGREELRKEFCSDKCEDAKPKEPAWIPWEGGECPLPDTVKRWEVMFIGGHKVLTDSPPSKYYWERKSDMADIVAYRVWEG